MLALVAYSLKPVKLLGPYKLTQHCWPTTRNNVVTCCVRLYGPFGETNNQTSDQNHLVSRNLLFVTFDRQQALVSSAPLRTATVVLPTLERTTSIGHCYQVCFTAEPREGGRGTLTHPMVASTADTLFCFAKVSVLEIHASLNFYGKRYDQYL